eukprot:1195253-Prorocentrum_minimum.AAC.8
MVNRGSTAMAESLDGTSKEELLQLLRFGADAVFNNAEGDGPSDKELDALVDRSEGGDDRRAALRALDVEAQQTAAEFQAETKAAPLAAFLQVRSEANIPHCQSPEEEEYPALAWQRWVAVRAPRRAAGVWDPSAP